MKKLRNSWEVRGKTKDEFFTEISALDNRTEYDRRTLRELTYLSILSKIDLETIATDHKYNEEKEWAFLPLNIRTINSTKKGILWKEKGEYVGGDKAIQTETEEIGGMIAYNENGSIHAYPMSHWAFKDLCDRAGVSCRSKIRHSLNRDKWLVENFGKQPITLVSRKEGAVKKIVAIRGAFYTGIPQEDCIKSVLKYLEQELGAAQVKEWMISNENTELTLRFPYKQEEIEAFYPDLPKGLEPIIKIKNSDIGASSFTVSAGFMVNGVPIYNKRGVAKTMHDTKFEASKIQAAIKKKCYNEFIAIPEELARLIGISIPMANTDEAIDEVLTFIKIDKKDGLKYIAKDIKRTLSIEMAMGEYTAYDVVMALLSVPERLIRTSVKGEQKDIPESTMTLLTETLSEAIYCPFSRSRGDEIYSLLTE